MNPRIVLRALALACVLLVPRGAAAGTPPTLPNIVFVLSDDHSLQTIGAYNLRLSKFCRQQGVTPNIDRLADRGGLFVNSFCGNSLCSPSRASILTGLHSHANGVMNLDEPIRAGTWTYPDALRAAGYQTAVIGKWHLSGTRPTTDYWRILPGQGDYWHPDFIGPDRREKHTGYATDIITDMSLDWMRRRDKTRPFMIAVQHKAPHRNWVPPTRYYRWLSDVRIPEPETLFDDYSGRTSSAAKQKMEIGRHMSLATDLKVFQGTNWPGEMRRMTPSEQDDWLAVFGPRNAAFTNAHLAGKDLVRWKYQEYMKDYLRCIKAVDDGVGRLVAYLKAEGIEDNTVVIYSSDQGFYNGEHGWFDKRWIYEESIHMPLVVRWPGVVKPGSRFTPMVQNIDYAETFVEMAGGTAPDGLHGRSLVPVLRGQTPPDWRKSIYYHYYAPDSHAVPPHYGVRTDRYTLGYFYRSNEWELYDLKKDPQQMRSVLNDPAYAKTVAEMKAELDRLKTGFKDTSE
jgi:arylsulfatase A-like enzyme